MFSPDLVSQVRGDLAWLLERREAVDRALDEVQATASPEERATRAHDAALTMLPLRSLGELASRADTSCDDLLRLATDDDTARAVLLVWVERVRVAEVFAAFARALPVSFRGRDAPDDDALDAWREARHRWPPSLDALRTAVELLERRKGREVRVTPHPLDTPFIETARVVWKEGRREDAYLLASLDAAPDKEALAQWARLVTTWRRKTGHGDWCWLVYRGAPCEAALRDQAAESQVELTSRDEYYGRLADLRGYLRAQSGVLASRTQYQPAMYIPQRARWREAHAPDQDTLVDDTLGELRGALASPEACLLMVLGDFGTGKTFLLHQLARALTEALTAGEPDAPTPLFIEMRDLNRASSLDELLAQHLASRGAHDVGVPALRHLIRQGRAVLLFDGFDELALRITYARAAHHLDTVLEAVDGRAKVVVTSRTQHFRSDAQVRTALARRLDARPHRVMHIERFERAQIRRFFANALGAPLEGGAVGERMALLDQVDDLAELGRTPRMLAFIAALPVERLRAAAEHDGSITSARLYEILVEDHWIAHELRRSDLPGAQQSLSREQLLESVERLALRLWTQTERTVSLDELRGVVREALEVVQTPERDVDVATFQVGSGSLLSREGEERFAFFHQSVMEWLVVRRAHRQWSPATRDELLAGARLSELMAQFLVEMLGEAEAARVVDAVKDAASVRMRENAARVAARLRRAVVDLHGQDLRELDMAPLVGRLDGADLRDAVLSGMQLRGVSMRRAVLRGAQLRGTDLTGADLTSADLRNADLTGAKFTGATLARVRMEGAKVDRASFLCAAVEEDVIPQGVHFAPTSTQVEQVEAAWLGAEERYESSLSLAFHPGDEMLVLHWKNQVAYADAEDGTPWRVTHERDGRPASTLVAPDAPDVPVWKRPWFWFNGVGARVRDGTPDYATGTLGPRESLVATGSKDGTVRVWDAHNGSLRSTLEGNGKAIEALVFSRDETHLAVLAGTEVHVWELAQSRRVATRNGPRGTKACALDRIGARLAALSNDRALVWRLRPGEGSNQVTIRVAPVHDAALSADGQRVAIACDGLRMWTPMEGALENVPSGGFARLVAWSRDGTLLASANGTVLCIHQAATGATRQTWRSEAYVCALALSPDGAWVAAGERDVLALYDVATGECRRLKGHSFSITCVTFLSDGARVLSGGHGRVHIWDITTGRELQQLDTGRYLASVKSLVVASTSATVYAAVEGVGVCMWDLTTGERTSPFNAPKRDFDFDASMRNVIALALSPGDTHVAAGTDDGIIHLWDLRSHKHLGTFSATTSEIRALAFTPDGARLISASTDGATRIWDVATQRLLVTLLTWDGGHVEFAPDGRYRTGGKVDGNFWHNVGLHRFEAGELDDWCDLRLPDGVSFFDARGPLVAKPRTPRPPPDAVSQQPATPSPPPAPAPPPSPVPPVAVATASSLATLGVAMLVAGRPHIAEVLAAVVVGAVAWVLARRRSS